MPTNAIRGQEATLRVAVDGEVKEGSFFNVNDLTITHRGELRDVDYLGEDVSKNDIQHSGFDLSFSVNEEDEKTLNYLQNIVERELNQQAHPVVTISVIFSYRNSTSTRVVVFYNVCLRMTDMSFGSRTDYIQTSFEAKAEQFEVLTA